METFLMKINGLELEVPKGSTVLQACRLHGIKVPTLCYDEELRAVGSCRICVVEAAGKPMMLAACVTPAEPNMDIYTDTDAVRNARKINLELMSASHQFNCQVCEKNADCRLQDYCYEYGVDTEKYAAGRHQIPVNDPNPFIKRDYNKCIMCTCCVRVCEEMVTASAIDIELRGFHSQIACAFDEPLAKSSCIFCGQCIMVCPVGALTSKVAAGRGRSYETDKTVSTCAVCGTGCTIRVDTYKGKMAGINSIRDVAQSPVNQGMLCGKGRFGWDFATAQNRLVQPSVDGAAASWQEAFDAAARHLASAKNIGMLISPHATTEELVAAKAFADAIKCKYFDDTSPLSQALMLPLLEATGKATGTILVEQIDAASDLIVVAGADAWMSHPVIAMKIRQKVATGKAKLIVVDSRRTELAKSANIFIQCEEGQEISAINQIIGALNAGGFASDVPSDYQKSLPVSITDLADQSSKLIAAAQGVAFLYGGDCGNATPLLGRAVCNLAIISGNLTGKPGAGVLPLLPANNAAGSALSGVAACGSERGIKQMLDAAAAGDLDVLLIVGENPEPYGVSDQLWQRAIQGAKVVIAEDMFAGVLTNAAQVVFPGACYLEKNGTFINSEGRIQQVRAAVKQTLAKNTIEILQGISESSKLTLTFGNASDLAEPCKIAPVRQDLQSTDASVNGVFPEYQAGVCPGFFYHNAAMSDCSLAFKFKKSEV
jgi:formate dehydrogenase alpha subunit